MLKNKELNITFISHACLRYEMKNTVLITDPWVTDDPVYCDSIYKFPKTNLTTKEIFCDVEWVYISHTHEDHFHIPSLQQLNKDVKFIIPDFSFHNQGRRGLVLIDTLLKLGFNAIFELKPWEKFEISTNTIVQMIPSSISRPFDWENSGLAVIQNKITILNMNDNIADLDLCEKINEKIGVIDIYFIQSASVTTYPSCFDYSDEEKHLIVLNKKEDYKYHDIVIKNINPKYLIPYAGDLGWFGNQYNYNFWSRSNPKSLVNYILSKGIKSFVWESGDLIKIKNNKINYYKESLNDWNDYDLLLFEHSDYYKSLVKKNEYRIQNSKIDDFEKHLDKYIESINGINIGSNSHIYSDASICYQILRRNGKSVFILVTCIEGRYLILKRISNPPSEIGQIHAAEENLWCEIIKGKMMLSQLTWRLKIKQNYVDKNIIHLLFGIGYHIDGDNRSKELKIRPYYKYDD